MARRYALYVLGLCGSGTLYPRRLNGVLSLDRGGVCLQADEPPPRRAPVRARRR